jgi:hypothetical protein
MHYPIWIPTYLYNKILGKSSSLPEIIPQNVKVIHPLTVFPEDLNIKPKIKRINNFFSLISIRLRLLFLGKFIFWSFDSGDIDLLRKINHLCFTIYDCVDYFTTQDSKARKYLLKQEKALIKNVDLFITISEPLKKARQNIRSADLVVNQGFDLASFTRKKSQNYKEKEELSNLKNAFAKIPKPIIGYIGNLTYRIDFKLLLKLIKQHPNVSFVFTDSFLSIPHDDKYSKTFKYLNKVFAYKNVYRIPQTKSKYVVRKIIKHYDIGIIPYNTKLDFNKYCYPLKMYEYFYFGIPVISTNIEVAKIHKKHVYVGNSVRYWKNAIKTLLTKKEPIKTKKERVQIAKDHSWDIRVSKILKFTKGHL